MIYFLTFAILMASLLFALIIVPQIRLFALRIDILDAPSHRKTHQNPTPHLGGIGIFLSAFIPYLFLVLFDIVPVTKPLFGLLVGAVAILGIGLIDDVFGLKALIKLIGQIAVATLSYGFGIQINTIMIPFLGTLPLGPLSFLVTVFWMVAMMNAINLIDGLDGLAGGISAIAAGLFSFICFFTGSLPLSLLGAAILGACLGFLRYNFYQATIFMGDSGSLFLGYVLSVICILGIIKTSLTFSWLIPILTLIIPIFDTALSIIRRIKNKQSIFKADNHHIHHQLIKAGLTPKQVVLSSYVISCLFGAIGLVLGLLSQQMAITLLIGVTLFLMSMFWVYKKKPAILMSCILFFL